MSPAREGVTGMSARFVLPVVLVATLTAAANADFVLVEASRSATAVAQAPVTNTVLPGDSTTQLGLWEWQAVTEGIAHDSVLPYGFLVLDARARQDSFIPETGTQISGSGDVSIDAYRGFAQFEGLNALVISTLQTTFSLTEPHDVELTGSISSAHTLGDFVFSGGAGELTHEVGVRPISYVGTLPPGLYSIYASVKEEVQGGPVSFGDQKAAHWDFALNLTPVPEPSAAATLALFAAGPLAALRCRGRG
jgi:hypothetical protein